MYVRVLVRTYVRPSRSVRLCTTNERLDVEAPIFLILTQIDNVSSFAHYYSNRQRRLTSVLRSMIRIKYIGKFIRDYRANGDR